MDPKPARFGILENGGYPELHNAQSHISWPDSTSRAAVLEVCVAVFNFVPVHRRTPSDHATNDMRLSREDIDPTGQWFSLAGSPGSQLVALKPLGFQSAP